MHFSKYFAIAALLATSTLAAPAAEAEPWNTKKPKTTTKTKTKTVTSTQTATTTSPAQQNECGNNAEPYCCNTDSKGSYTTCKLMGSGSTCSQTTVCCNANNSIQVCLGNAVITV